MTDFVIVVVAAAAMAAPAPAPSAPAAALVSPPVAAATIPLNAPTVGFHTYKGLAACEQAAARLGAPAGSRLVCVPVEPFVGEMASAY